MSQKEPGLHENNLPIAFVLCVFRALFNIDIKIYFSFKQIFLHNKEVAFKLMKV